MKKNIKYFIAHYGVNFPSAWDNDQKRWVPIGMKLYISAWDSIEEIWPIIRSVKKACSGWRNDIYIDSFISSIDF